MSTATATPVKSKRSRLKTAKPIGEGQVIGKVFTGDFANPQKVTPPLDPYADQTAKLKELYGRSVATQLECGKILHGISEKMSGDEFTNWYTLHVKWSKSQIYRLMAAYRTFHSVDVNILINISITALYALCGENEPAKNQRIAMVEMAKAGTYVDMEQLKTWRRANIKSKEKKETDDKPRIDKWSYHGYESVKHQMGYDEVKKVIIEASADITVEILVKHLVNWLNALKAKPVRKTEGEVPKFYL